VNQALPRDARRIEIPLRSRPGTPAHSGSPKYVSVPTPFDPLTLVAYAILCGNPNGWDSALFISRTAGIAAEPVLSRLKMLII
jgi:hypothetical protein